MNREMLVVGITLLTVLLGLALGSISPINEHLHWNLWLFLPISGMVFGAFVSWVQFSSARALQIQISRRVAAMLSLGIMLAYFSTDIGLYYSLRIDIYGSENLPDGSYPIRDLVSFFDYMGLRLGSSSVNNLHAGIFELGSTGTTLSYFVDLLAVGLIAWFTFRKLSFELPYCGKCARYMNSIETQEILLPFGTNIGEFRKEIGELVNNGEREAVLSFLHKHAAKDDFERCRGKVALNQASCRICGAQMVSGVFHQIERFDWLEVSGSSFTILQEHGSIADN
ncbi:MAG: hypothetical protein ABI644_13260 [Arenimonas sp.]